MFKGEQTLHNIHLPVSQFHIQNAIAWDLSNTPQNPDPRGVRHLSLLRAEPPPLWDPKPAHMCRYRYYSAHKTPQFHLKVVSRWNTLAASKLGSLQTAQAWLSFCTSHSSPMGNGCKLAFVTQTCSRHQNPQWVSIERKWFILVTGGILFFFRGI